MNRARAGDLMTSHGVSAMVAVTPDNVCYLTGHVTWANYVYRELPCIAAFSLGSSPGTDLVVPRSDTPYVVTYHPHADVVVGYGGKAGVLPRDPGSTPTSDELELEALQDFCGQYDSPTRAIVDLLRQRGINSGTIVIDDPYVVPELPSALAAAFPKATVVASNSLFLNARLVKTADEIDKLRAAAALNERALQAALSAIRVGEPESEASRTWRSLVAADGAMPLWFHLGTGERGAYVFPPQDEPVEDGELFIVDAGMRLRGYFSDIGACGSIGPLTPRAEEEWYAVKDAFTSAEVALKPGVLGSEVYAAMMNSLSQSPLKDATSVIPFAGHTIGIAAGEFPFLLCPAEPVSDPYLPATTDIPLPVGATINLELLLGRFGYGGYQIEKTYVLTESGAEELIPFDREIRIIA